MLPVGVRLRKIILPFSTTMKCSLLQPTLVIPFKFVNSSSYLGKLKCGNVFSTSLLKQNVFEHSSPHMNKILIAFITCLIPLVNDYQHHKCHASNFTTISKCCPRSAIVNIYNKCLYKNHVRNYSDGSDNSGNNKHNDRKPLHINMMDIDYIVKPSIIHAMRNRFFSFLITAYYDETFSLSGFLAGSSQAVEYVSKYLSREQFDQLQDLITPEALMEVRRNIARMTDVQKRAIQVNAADMYLKFIYEIDLMFDKDEKDSRMLVEIKAIFHCFTGFSDMLQVPPQEFIEFINQNRDNYYVCNYRFIREFRKGHNEDWTINQLNHFYPKAL